MLRRSSRPTRTTWQTTTSNLSAFFDGSPFWGAVFFESANAILTFSPPQTLDFFSKKCYNTQAQNSTSKHKAQFIGMHHAFGLRFVWRRCRRPGAAPLALGCRRLIAPESEGGRALRFLQRGCFGDIRLNTKTALGRERGFLLLVVCLLWRVLRIRLAFSGR